MFNKTIISDFFTTVSFSQALNSIYLMSFGIHKLKYGKEKQIFEEKLLSYLGKKDKKIISFYNGRSAIFHALKIIGINNDDEVIVNAYNCVSVSNAVIQSGAKIIYSDIEEDTLSFDFNTLKGNITKNTKVIIIQHTFGKLSRDYQEIVKYSKEKGIILIEDCAHSLGNGHISQGDFALYSTGRDKVISSVTGGFLIINNSKYFSEIIKVKSKLEMPSNSIIYKNLNYNIVGYKSCIFYDLLKIGRLIIYISRKFKLITEILTIDEKKCNYNEFNLEFPNSLAYLGIQEFKKIDIYNEKRLIKSQYYLNNINNKNIEHIFLNNTEYNGYKYPLLLKSITDLNNILKKGKDNKILFGTSWSGINIAPIGTSLDKSGYIIGSCPVAEDISKRILTLPNHKLITKNNLNKVINILNKY